MSSTKRPFLVCYDYGTGGLWGIIHARSEVEIRVDYPELVIAEDRPDWMDDDLYEQIKQVETHDIDGPPWGMLNAVIADRGT